jgi:hypothetical protein
MMRIPKWVRALLHLYPGEFRDEYGGEMLADLQSRGRDEGRRFRIGAILDTLRTAPREHGATLKQDLRYGFRSLRTSPIFVLPWSR